MHMKKQVLNSEAVSPGRIYKLVGECIKQFGLINALVSLI